LLSVGRLAPHARWSSHHRQFMAEGPRKRAQNRLLSPQLHSYADRCCLSRKRPAQGSLWRWVFRSSRFESHASRDGPHYTGVISGRQRSSRVLRCFSSKPSLRPFEALTQTFHLASNNISGAGSSAAQAVEDGSNSSRRFEELPAGSDSRRARFTRFSILAMAGPDHGQIQNRGHCRCCGEDQPGVVEIHRAGPARR